MHIPSIHPAAEAEERDPLPHAIVTERLGCTSCCQPSQLGHRGSSKSAQEGGALAEDLTSNISTRFEGCPKTCFRGSGPESENRYFCEPHGRGRGCGTTSSTLRASTSATCSCSPCFKIWVNQELTKALQTQSLAVMSLGHQKD